MFEKTITIGRYNWNIKTFQLLVMPITETGCWIWLGGTRGKSGYGCMTHPKTQKPTQAHRFSWELHRGEIPEGMLVLHKCDVPSCVNPDHLYLGTHGENMKDMVKRNRRPKKYKTLGVRVAEKINV